MYSLWAPNELYHHGVLGQKCGVRRYQNSDGTFNNAGKKRVHKFSKDFYKVSTSEPEYKNTKSGEKRYQRHINKKEKIANKFVEDWMKKNGNLKLDNIKDYFSYNNHLDTYTIDSFIASLSDKNYKNLNSDLKDYFTRD